MYVGDLSCGCAVGYGRSFSTGSAVQQALEPLSRTRPELLLAFAGGKLDPVEAIGAVRRRFPGVPVVGGSAAGVITAEARGYSGLEVGLLAFDDPSVTPRVLVAPDFRGGEHEAGRRLGEGLRREACEGALVVLLFDSVAEAAPLRLHPASALVAGVHAGLGNKRVHLVGGGLLTDLNMGGAWLFDGAAVRRHAAVALAFPPRVAATTVIAHGCRPVSDFMEVTRAEGAVVHELDGRPALGVLEAMLGLRVAGDAPVDLSLVATLGQKRGDRFAPFREDAYVNRLVLGGDRADGSITLFEPDLREGAVVQVMARDNELMLGSVREAAVAAGRAARGGPGAPLFGLYVDCAGRASARTGAREEEADVLRRHLDPALPLLGFYSGVEVAPVGGEAARALDWTGVLTAARRLP